MTEREVTTEEYRKGERLPWRIWMVLPFALALSCAAVAQDDGDVAVLLERMHASQQRNAKLAEQYTSDEFWHNVNYDKNGKKTVDESAKYENVFVEGLPYRKKVEVNGKPLSGKAAQEEEKRYEKAVKERRGMSIAQKRHWYHGEFGYSYSLPMCCLSKLFDNRIVRHETIGGRDTIVVESTPKLDAKPANDAEKSSLDWKETTWIDAADAMPARIQTESLKDMAHVLKGMTDRLDFVRFVGSPSPDGQPQAPVWLLQSFAGRFRFKFLWVGATGETDQTWSNFKRFHVDMRLLEDTVEEVPQGSTPQ
jgi:hypothetical protein